MPKGCAKKAIKRRMDFKLYAPEVSDVSLAGDFNSWDTNSISLKKDKKGVWKKSLSLFPGRYEYKFYVDRNWVEDPNCSERVPNAFGSSNCVLTVK